MLNILYIMIINNKFYIKKLTTVVIFGYSKKVENLIKITKDLNLKMIIITGEDQAKNLNKYNVNFHIFNNINEEFKNFILKNININETLFVSRFARYIFKKDTIENFFKNNLINFHDSRLPIDAGGGGYSWRIMKEDRISNQVAHIIDEGIDTGPMIDYSTSLFPKNCQIPIDLEDFAEEGFLKLFKRILVKIKNGDSFNLIYQSRFHGSYNPRLDTEINGLIDWNLDSYDLGNFINAFDEPYKGASTYLNNGNSEKLYLKKTQLHGGDSSNHPYMAGLVIRHDIDWIVVSTKSKHTLLIEEILDINGKNQLHKIKIGDRFITPFNELYNSKFKRVRFNSTGKIKGSKNEKN
tara:strand:- start:23 stop:1078 length:1056 start_codon:yes stop_codon:yes gene_type:complete